MLTPNDIRNVVFTKGMGGYKTSEVDVFIDECADTVEALIKEKNAAVEAFNREKQDLQKKLEVMDNTAITLCMNNKIPIMVFNIDVPGNIVKACEGENLGTLIEEK